MKGRHDDRRSLSAMANNLHSSPTLSFIVYNSPRTDGNQWTRGLVYVSITLRL